MNEIRLLFDECLGAPIMESLAPLLAQGSDRFRLMHVLEFQKQGVPDSEWVPRIAAEGWIVITTDRGKRNKREAHEEKLPYLCRLYRVTHILLSATLHHRRGIEKAIAIASVWSGLIAAASATRGTRFSLQITAAGHARLVNTDVEQKTRRRRTKSDDA